MAGEQTTHAVQLELADGRTYRFGPDERDVDRVPLAVEFETEVPGGFGPGSITLPRPDPLTSHDAKLFASARIYHAPSNMTLHEGRVVGTPQVGPSQISLQLEGWAKHLTDDETARAIFYDRDFSNWGGMTLTRKIERLSVPVHIEDGSTTWDTQAGIPAIDTTLTDPWSDTIAASEAWYDAKGLSLGGVDYAWKKSASVDNTDTNYSWSIKLSTDDIGTSTDTSANLRAAGPGSGTVAASDTGKKWALLQLVYLAAKAGTQGKAYTIAWTLSAPFGDHGLTLQGSVAAPNTGRGLLVSDMAAYIVGRWAPLLNFTTGPSGSIQPTSFVVPHSVYMDPVAAQDMIDGLSALGGNSTYPLDWGVYDNRQFFMASPGSYGKTWRVRRDQATEPSDDGPDSAARLNGIYVTYDDGTGQRFSVGPPGSGASLEDSSLQDTSLDNPANRDGARHWKVFDAGITSQAGALLIGQLKLADANRNDWRGSIAIKSQATDDAGNTYPAAMVRAGDQVIVEDDPDTRPRRIVQTSYTPTTVQASCGAPPDRLDTLLARLGIVLTGKLG